MVGIALIAFSSLHSTISGHEFGEGLSAGLILYLLVGIEPDVNKSEDLIEMLCYVLIFEEMALM